MNLLDLVLLAVFAVAAVGGWRLGFLARVASWIGLGLGLVISAKLLPVLLDSFSGPDPAAKLFLAGGILIAGSFIGQAAGLLIGHAVRKVVAPGPVAGFDKSIGAFVGILGVVAMVWVLTPAMADVPGGFSRLARSSVITKAVSEGLPRPPDTLQALRRLVGENNFPRVFDDLERSPETGPPPASIGMTDAIVAKVSASTVKVSGVACRRIQEGSGFAAGENLVVTNAHVVAGQKATTVERPDGKVLKASVVLFDSDRDLALLQVPGLSQVPLTIGAAKQGENGAVFGHPGGQTQLRIAPAAIRQRVDARGRDLYDSRGTSRDVFILASRLRPGDSGGALVDVAGEVVGVAFAIAPDRSDTAYALTTNEVHEVMRKPRAGAVPTGPCLNKA